MTTLIWKVRYALRLNYLTGLPIRQAWRHADAAYEDSADECPLDAVDEELSCWSD